MTPSHPAAAGDLVVLPDLDLGQLHAEVVHLLLHLLLLVATHYLSEAEQMSAADPSIATRTLHDVTDSHTPGHLGTDEIVLAHLASCAIRLATVCEKKGEESYRSLLYDKSWCRKGGRPQQDVIADITRDLDQHIHFLLRDNVAHEENTDSQMATDRFAILMSLTVDQVLRATDTCAQNTAARA